MKLARLLLAPTLLLALGLPANAQMAGYPASAMFGPHGSNAPGRQVSYADPMPGEGEVIGGPAGMAPGPVYSDMMPGQGGPMPGGMPGGPGGDCFSQPCDPGRIHHHIGYGYVSIDALYWKREQAAPSPLTFDSVTGNRDLTGASMSYPHKVLPRLTAGYVWDNGLALEGTYFYVDNIDTFNDSNSATGIDGFNALGPFNAADRILVEGSMKMQNGEISVVETNHFFNFLAGFRWMEIRDRSTLTAFNPLPAQGSYNFSSYNKLFGGQAGVRAKYDWGLFGISAQGKAGMYFNDASNFTNVVNVDPTVDGERKVAGQGEAFIGEVEAMLYYRPSASWTIRGGYNAMWINQVALANDQIIGGANAANTGFFLNQRSDLFFHGPFAGAEFRW